MHKLTFYPLGNADCCLIELQCGQDILIDFAATKDVGDDDDPRCDLPELLKEHLKSRGKDHFDIVAFSHLDKDHFQGSTDFFYLQHAKKYQGNDRKHIKTMWIPAALITEKSPDDDEAVILQKEARYRFRNGRDIRVFSRPERLRKWCEENDVDLDERLDLITDAGELVPEFNIREHDAEFFVHSPFAVRQNEHTVEDRNEDSLVLHLTIDVDGIQTKSLLLADSTHEVLAQIVDITKSKGNRKRLEWDILKIPHHCSYLSIGPKRGTNRTTPTEQVSWLYEQQVQNRAIAVSTSRPIPLEGSDEDKDSQPPHRQAARYYRDVVNVVNGQFVVTMEHPSKAAPKPVVIEIKRNKATLVKSVMSAPGIATSQRAPRAGK